MSIGYCQEIFESLWCFLRISKLITFPLLSAYIIFLFRLRDIYHPFGEMCLRPGTEMLEPAVYDYLDLHFVEKLPCEKHGWLYFCKDHGCDKVFHARLSVHNHLERKHPELVREAFEKANDAVFLHNYMK